MVKTGKRTSKLMRTAGLRLVIPLLLHLLLSEGCRPGGERDIRNYYFPLKVLTEGTVYEFRAVDQEGLAPQYRYYRSLLQDTAVVLTETLYSPEYLPELLANYRMVQGGMQADGLYLFYPDSTDRRVQVEAELIYRDVFPFRVKEDGGVYLYHARWTDPFDPQHHTALVRNRYYAGDTTIMVLGNEYPAVAFQLREVMEDDRAGLFEQEFTGLEIYAKGLGLVYYHKNVAEGMRLAYRLADRYPMTELEKRFRERQQNAKE